MTAGKSNGGVGLDIEYHASGYLERVASEVVSVLRSDIDPEADAVGSWSVKDVAAHLGGLMGVYAGFVRGDSDPLAEGESAADRITRANAACVDARSEERLAELVDEMEVSVRGLIEELASHDPAETVRLWQARPGTPELVAGMALTEFLVHGDDISRAARSEWRIPADAARAACLDTAWALPWMFDPATTEGVDASWVVRLRGGGARWFRIRDGAADVEEWNRQQSDCTILADPVSMLLLTYGRRSMWREIAKVNLLVWGRRPWTAARVLRWFPSP